MQISKSTRSTLIYATRAHLDMLMKCEPLQLHIICKCIKALVSLGKQQAAQEYSDKLRNRIVAEVQ